MVVELDDIMRGRKFLPKSSSDIMPGSSIPEGKFWVGQRVTYRDAANWGILGYFGADLGYFGNFQPAGRI